MTGWASLRASRRARGATAAAGEVAEHTYSILATGWWWWSVERVCVLGRGVAVTWDDGMELGVDW